MFTFLRKFSYPFHKSTCIAMVATCMYGAAALAADCTGVEADCVYKPGKDSREKYCCLPKIPKAKGLSKSKSPDRANGGGHCGEKWEQEKNTGECAYAAHIPCGNGNPTGC